ncbi:SH3 domain-containing protein [Saccharibacillus qingshengii]|uniref:SH3 domain-containing protein n=1 Tax=Saccharibacillus qingshengii TaxID=1763540 RepID=UPI00155765D6|nr:SH3 domain-containing protein [Saccharibacillus qingshengii]
MNKGMRTDTIAIQKVTVIRAYKTAYPEPIELQKGECILTGEEDEENPGWIRCHHPYGRSGWVPVNRLIRDESGKRAIVLAAYSAHELSVGPGESLTVLEAVNGWLRCRRMNGEEGWLPNRHVEWDALH